MTSTHASRISTVLKRCPLFLLAVGLGSLLLLAGTRPMSAAEQGASDQCVACHTDAAKLKALTPPDPPPSEEGEG
jgi:hypothetical protein